MRFDDLHNPIRHCPVHAQDYENVCDGCEALRKLDTEAGAWEGNS